MYASAHTNQYVLALGAKECRKESREAAKELQPTLQRSSNRQCSRRRGRLGYQRKHDLADPHKIKSLPRQGSPFKPKPTRYRNSPTHLLSGQRPPARLGGDAARRVHGHPAHRTPNHHLRLFRVLLHPAMLHGAAGSILDPTHQSRPTGRQPCTARRSASPRPPARWKLAARRAVQ